MTLTICGHFYRLTAFYWKIQKTTQKPMYGTVSYWENNLLVSTIHVKSWKFAVLPRSPFLHPAPAQPVLFMVVTEFLHGFTTKVFIPRYFSLIVPISFKSNSFYISFNLQFSLPLSFSYTLSLKNPVHLACSWVSRGLGFASCTVTMRGEFLVFCRLAAASRGWVRLRLDPFGRTVGDGGFFHHATHMSGFSWGLYPSVLWGYRVVF